MLFDCATTTLDALKKGQITSSELVAATIRRIQETDALLNAVVVRDFERAAAAAAQADRALRKREFLPLLGLPVTVKEAFDVRGLPTSWGLPGQHGPAAADALLVARLKAAGAIILGKTNTAMMLADWQTANPLYGVTNNPWDPRRTPGGSSGGGAAAVAAGMTPLDFGSDLAGSLRIPAAFCGVFAHRPSTGLLPMRGFAPPMAPRMRFSQPLDQATLGPIARTPADLKVALEVTLGPDSPEATAWHLALAPPRHTKLSQYRVLIIDEHPLIPTSGAVRGAIGDLAKHLQREDCKVSRSAAEIPDLQDLCRTFTAFLMALLGVDMPEGEYRAMAERARTSPTGPQRQDMTMTHREWMQLDRHRLELAAHWARTFENWDVVICPAAPTTAFVHDERPFEQRMLEIDGRRVNYELLPTWSTLAAPTGLPVTCAPLGQAPDGLPVGIQIIGPRLEDFTPLAFAQLLEKQLGYGFEAPPR